jgi:hypothetical protein
MNLDRKWLLLVIGLTIVFLVDFPILAVALNSFRTTENILSSQNILATEPTLLAAEKHVGIKFGGG